MWGIKLTKYRSRIDESVRWKSEIGILVYCMDEIIPFLSHIVSLLGIFSAKG